jgi:hypothetical protein
MKVPIGMVFAPAKTPEIRHFRHEDRRALDLRRTPSLLLRFDNIHLAFATVLYDLKSS